MQRLQRLAQPIFYTGRVALEFVRQVAQHQGVTQASSYSQAQQGLGHLITSFQTKAWRQYTLKQVSEAGGYAVTIVGFFIVGEMIGRRSIVGYTLPGSHHH